jgi:hypothetical protein
MEMQFHDMIEQDWTSLSKRLILMAVQMVLYWMYAVL